MRQKNKIKKTFEEENMDNSCMLLTLPPELITNILRYLSPIEVINFGLCSRECSDYAKHTLRYKFSYYFVNIPFDKFLYFLQKKSGTTNYIGIWMVQTQI